MSFPLGYSFLNYLFIYFIVLPPVADEAEVVEETRGVFGSDAFEAQLHGIAADAEMRLGNVAIAILIRTRQGNGR